MPRHKFAIEEYRTSGLVNQPVPQTLWLDLPGPGAAVSRLSFGLERWLRVGLELPETWTLLTDLHDVFMHAITYHNHRCRLDFTLLDDWETLLFGLWQWLPGCDIGARHRRGNAPFKILGHDRSERRATYWTVNDNRIEHRATGQKYFGAKLRYCLPSLAAPPPIAKMATITTTTAKGREVLRDELVYQTAKDPSYIWRSWRNGPTALAAARRKFPAEAGPGGLLAIGKTVTAQCWARVRARLEAEGLPMNRTEPEPNPDPAT